MAVLIFCDPVQDEDLHFRQSPSLQDCHPSSEKLYISVLHEDVLLQVGNRPNHHGLADAAQ